MLVQAFRRMVRALEFDVSEMALTTYLVAKAHGVRVHRAAGLPGARLPPRRDPARHAVGHPRAEGPGGPPRRRQPRLHGHHRRLGPRHPAPTSTASTSSRVTWVLSGDEHVAGVRAAAQRRPGPGPAQDVADMVTAGELAAAIGVAGRPPGPRAADPGRRRRPATRRCASAASTRSTTWSSSRDELLAAHPDLAADVFDAFAEAKRRYVDALRRRSPSRRRPTGCTGGSREITGADPLPYGIEPNRAMLEQLIRARGRPADPRPPVRPGGRCSPRAPAT